MSSDISQDILVAERLTGLGGSDAGGYMGLGYGCRRRVYYHKTSTPMDYPDSLPFALFDAGHRCEGVILREYVRRTGRVVTVPETAIRHPEHGFMLVHLDGLIDEGFDTPVGDGVLEIKSMGDYAWDSFLRNGPPIGYTLQLQHAMFVTGLKWGAFAFHHRLGGDEAIPPEEWEIEFFDVAADAEKQSELLREASTLWSMIQSREPPARLPKGDKRCEKCEFRDTCWWPIEEEEIKKSIAKHKRLSTYHANRAAQLSEQLVRESKSKDVYESIPESNEKEG